MDNLVVQEKGYTVIYDTAKGEIGFIGIDDHSGGYPYFASFIENRHVYKTAAQAFHLKESTQKNGKNWYDSANVHFGTMRVVKIATVFQEIEADADKIFFEQTLKKLTDAELDVIKRHIGDAK